MAATGKQTGGGQGVSPQWTLWAAITVLVIVIAGLVRISFHSPQEEAPLEGDMEHSTADVAAILKATAPKDRVAVLRKYADSSNPGVRYAVTDAMGDTADNAIVPDLEKAFTDSSSVVRQRAMESVIKIDQARGLQLILTALQDEDVWIREAAIGQLSNVALRQSRLLKPAVPALIKALDDPGGILPIQAMNILRKVADRPWSVKARAPKAQRDAAIAKWKQWWSEEKAHAAPGAFIAIPTPVRPLRTDPTPRFAVADLSGARIDDAGRRGKVTLINFWGTWCPPCKQEIPDLVRLDAAYRSRGLELIGIALGEKNGAEGLKSWCNEHGVLYRQSLAVDSITDAFGHIEEVPVSVLIDRKGRIRYRWDGERDFDTFRSAVERLLAEP